MIQHEAVIEIQEVFEWYEKKKWGLGFEFIESLEHCYQKISETPEYYLKVGENYRRIMVSRFPYKIFFELTGDAVTIVSVKHSVRNVDF